jgi:hypothetical protein
MPRIPSACPIRRQAWILLLYRLGSTCRRHLTRSSGVTAVCVVPCRGEVCSLPAVAGGATYTSKDTAHCACSVVFSRIQLDLASLGLGLCACFLVLVDGGIGQLAGLCLGRLRNTPCREDWTLQRIFRRAAFGCWPRKRRLTCKDLVEAALCGKQGRHVAVDDHISSRRR